ncbi:mucin-2-like [Spea bombifrons]|uniref:mucin-2-like n=1 Tax=Spea bombifrons TaxID=233779 RepID=UPI00234B9E1C|nr:mucin-2-like [Spea bombifrons]
MDAKTCADCNGTNAICTQNTNYVTCSCKPGYAGNGYNCTQLVYCNTETCCLPGYVWDTVTKTCIDVNECATPTLNKCLSGNSSDCINRAGMHLCINNQSKLCPVNPCEKYKDCMKVNSSSSEIKCADPCENYSWLDGSSRLYNISSTGRFLTDRYNFGWFRYYNSLGIKYGCVEALKCGSLEPFTLNGSHPSIEEGVKLVPLNINSLTGCRSGSSIPVKACPGGYYVYKFSGNLKYDVYCTEFTPPPELPTTKSPTTQTTDPPTTKPPTTPTPEPSTTTQTTEPPTTPTPEPSTTTQTSEPPTTPTPELSTTTQTTVPPTTPTPELSTTTQTSEPSTTTQTTEPPTTTTPELSTTTQTTELPTTPTPKPSTTTQTTVPPTTPMPEPSTTTQPLSH